VCSIVLVWGVANSAADLKSLRIAEVYLHELKSVNGTFSTMNTEIITSPETRTPTANILIVDDHEVMRLGIRNLLETVPSWNILAEAGNGREAVKLALELSPDVIIMDITMPEMNGLEAAAAISKARPDLPVILFSLHLSEELFRHFERGSIRGAVGKGEAARDLVAAVRKVLAGGTFFPPKGATKF
jgi:DNA-binding NarL/FixJ family response regulator